MNKINKEKINETSKDIKKCLTIMLSIIAAIAAITNITHYFGQHIKNMLQPIDHVIDNVTIAILKAIGYVINNVIIAVQSAQLVVLIAGLLQFVVLTLLVINSNFFGTPQYLKHIGIEAAVLLATYACYPYHAELLMIITLMISIVLFVESVTSYVPYQRPWIIFITLIINTISAPVYMGMASNIFSKDCYNALTLLYGVTALALFMFEDDM